MTTAIAEAESTTATVETVPTRVRGDRASKALVEERAEKLVKIISRDSRKQGYSNLAVADLARRSGMPRSTVRRYLAQLQDEGRIVRRSGGCGRHADGRPSFVPALTAVASNPEGVRALLALAG